MFRWSQLFLCFREEQERLRKIEEEMRALEEAKLKEAQRLKDEEEHRRL